ncbi:MAG: hypothetical protein LBU22_13050 [Dysgonamonadaceae bacterium]|jgi:hypothetical protein|nr:hypothetical protein [Dysgonamonadaceae bacterium]
MKRLFLSLTVFITLFSACNDEQPNNTDVVEGYVIGTFVGYLINEETGQADGYTDRGYCIRIENGDTNQKMDFYTFDLPQNLFDFPPVTKSESDEGNCGPIFSENDKAYKIKFNYQLLEEKNRLKFFTGPCTAMEMAFLWKTYHEARLTNVEK